MSPLHQIRGLRRLVLPIFARINPGDVTIRHHFTGDRFRLHSFKHRGYWFHGRRREAETIARFQRLLAPGQTVLEVGGHIGYFSVLFSSLVGPGGSVVVFEPGDNNLGYLRANVGGRPNVRIVEKGAGAAHETRSFWVEDLTGQNNSLVRDFRGFEVNRANAGVRASTREVRIEVVPIDEVVAELGLEPRFVKIDVEGAEFEVLRGASSAIDRFHPRLMVEIQADQQAIFDWFTERGYRCFSERGQRIGAWTDLHLNTFCLHESDGEGLRAVGLRA